MMTSEPSQGFLFEDLSISSVEDSPASRSASPGSKKGPKTSGISGPRCHESSEKSDPRGFLLRTFLACELSRLTSCLKTWKDRGTPAGRSWWVLMTSEGRTGESGSGSSQDWGTPRVTTNGGIGNGARTKGSRLEDQACWPTPHGMQVDNPRMAGPTGNELGRAVTKQWPTPRAEDSEQTGGHRGSADTLTAAGRLWASPQARDWKYSGPTQGNRKSPNLGTQCAGLVAPESPSTLGKPQGWPTPTAHDGRRPGVDIHSTQGGDLSRGVALWRTPSASLIDPKPEGTKLTGRTPQDPQIGIADQVMATEWPTPRANRHGALDSHGKSPIRGSLNPRWVAQLMGFPADWLDSPPPIAAKPSRRSETRSAQSTRITSEEPS